MLFGARIPKKIFITAIAKSQPVMIANNAETNAFIANVRLANTANKKLLKHVEGINALKRDHLMMRSLREEDRKINGGNKKTGGGDGS